MEVSLIAALAANYVIGKDNDLAWSLPEDMAFFKRTTSGHAVLMGRKNYESIPEKYRPLKNRFNIVVTRKASYTAPGCEVVQSVEAGISAAKTRGEKELFIIGGAQIYRYALQHNLATCLYLTWLDQSFKGDAIFPQIDFSLWHGETVFSHSKDDKHACSFVTRVYRKT